MSSLCTIRDANPEDSERIAQLLSKLGYPCSVEFVQSKIALFQEQPSTCVIVAELANEVVGVLSFDFMPLFHQEGNIGMITSLSIAPNAQRKGIGKALVSAAEEIARKSGCIKVAVASGIHREEAHSFYRNLGYEETTKRFLKML